MPEMLEAEMARVVLAERALGREIAKVHAPDAWFIKRGASPAAVRTALRRRHFVAARRIGKQLLLDTDDAGPTVGLHLGMSGRVIVDGHEAGDPLVYASNRDVAAWRRFGVSFADGGSLWLRDPRRLGAVELDPDEVRWGIDASVLRRVDLERVVERSAAPIKAVLMDQSRIAGLGNLLADETLWRAGIDPARPARSLTADERVVLHRAIRTTVRTLGRRGGSHTGDHMEGREPGGRCPRDGAPMLRRTIGGRTTYSCALHQR
jgi:formamidopyrimidine-DNA glycosylase